MPHARVTHQTKDVIKECRKKLQETEPELREMTLSENYIINRAVELLIYDLRFAKKE